MTGFPPWLQSLNDKDEYYFPLELMEHPTEVLCQRCYDDGFGSNCSDCSGTGRHPIPFSEVWDLE